MSIEIKVPAMGESITEATVARWFKKQGDAVARDEPLLELETDKVTVEVPAPADGSIESIAVEAGATVQVGTVLGAIAEGAAPKKYAPEAAAPAKPAPAPEARPKTPARQPAAEDQQMPSVRRIAEETGLRPSEVSGTGKDGRVTKGDMLAALEARAAERAATPVAVAPAGPRPRADREERVPMSRLRRTIALRLKESQNTAAQLTTFNEVDMSQVMTLRGEYKETFEKKHHVRLGFMSFFVKACIASLKELPSVNGEIEGDDIIYKNYYDIGVAVATERGLIVPVVRDADRLSLAQIEAAIADFGARARDGRIKLEELQGGTFTISNGGVFGSLMSTPILNAPQSGILGMHKIQPRPVAIDGKVEIRPMMYLALSYDHRLVEGREAVTFLVRVKENLEDPQRLLLDVSNSFDVVIIGGGPGGYNAAIRAGQLGLASACVDSRGTFGGTCLNIGCIPSKALLYTSEMYDLAAKDFAKLGIKASVSLDLPAMMAHKTKVVGELTRGVEYLFRKYKTEGIVGEARIRAPDRVDVKLRDGSTRSLQTRHIVIATGSDVTPLPGVSIDEQQIVSSTGALTLESVPKRLVVVGCGYIGLELGSVWRRLGSDVTVVEFLDRITPGLDAEIAKQFQRILQRQGMRFLLSSRVTGVERAGEALSVAVESAKGDRQTLDADVMLVAIGRRPFTYGFGLEDVGVKRDDKGRVITDHEFRTNIEGIRAIGDVREGPMLAHKAEDEAIACIERIAGRAGHVNYDAIPAVVYTEPQVASVGKTEDELKAEGIAYKTGKFPFTANPRAKTLAATDGFVKMLADAKTDRVLGVHILGTEAGDLIAEATLAIEFGAASEDIARTSHAHPTLSEAVRQAAMSVEGWAMQM